MNSIKFSVDNKFIKKLNDLNQEAKNIFTFYYIFPNGIIVGGKYDKLEKGTHYALTSTEVLPHFEDIIKLNSDALYRIIKDNKKDINQFEIIDNIIYLSGENKYMIGNVIPIISSQFSNISEIDIMNKIQSFNFTINLSEDDVIDMVKNEYRDIASGIYRTKVTKELIPGLKKSHNIQISMFNNGNKETFNLCIQAQRNSLISFHIYTCLIL